MAKHTQSMNPVYFCTCWLLCSFISTLSSLVLWLMSFEWLFIFLIFPWIIPIILRQISSDSWTLTNVLKVMKNLSARIYHVNLLRRVNASTNGSSFVLGNVMYSDRCQAITSKNDNKLCLHQFCLIYQICDGILFSVNVNNLTRTFQFGPLIATWN